jgi:hypothetical protein
MTSGENFGDFLMAPPSQVKEPPEKSGRFNISGTTTAAGLRVKAVLKRSANETGERVSNDEMRRLRLKRHAVCPKCNYTLRPRRRRH